MYGLKERSYQLEHDPHRRMSKGQAPGQAHLCQIPQAQFVAPPPYQDEQHDGRGIVKAGTGRTRPFIEAPRADLTAKLPIPERRALGLFLR